jgi:replicative DNA helicase
MSKEQLVERMISAYTGISVKRLRNRAIEPTEWSLIHETGNSLCSLPLWVNDLSSASVQEIRGESISLHNKLKKQNGQVLDLIVVDYLQLATTDEGRSREQEVAEISRALRALAKDLQVPILVLAQLNRELEKRANKRPILSDLRESGQIEQDASVVFFLHRESLYCDECMDPELTCTKGHEHDAEFIVAKNRAGERGLVRLRFNGARQTFAPCQKAPNEYTDRVLRTETTKTSLSKQRLKRNGFNANI